MYLIETSIRDVLPSIEVGDKFIINTVKGSMEFSTISAINGNFLKLNRDSKNKYTLNIDDAIEDNILSFKNDDSKMVFKISFNYIKIEHKNGGNDTIIKPEEDKVEPEKVVTPKNNKKNDKDIAKEKMIDQIKADVEVDRIKIRDDFNDLEINDIFNLGISKAILINNELAIDDEKSSTLKIKVLDIKKDFIQCKFLEIEGEYSKKLMPYKNKIFRFYTGKYLINEDHNSGVAINLFIQENINKRIVLKDVIYLEVIDDIELDDTDDLPNNIDNMLQDKDLMSLMKNKTWLDRVLKRDSKGIIPSNKLVGDKGDDKYVTFQFLSDSVREDYHFSLVKNSKYRGKLLDNGNVIRILGSNRKESFKLTKMKNSGNIFLVEVDYIVNNDSSKKEKRTSYNNSKIKILT